LGITKFSEEMIQRVQSVYLFLSAVLLLIMISHPIAQISIREDLVLHLNFLDIKATTDSDFEAVSARPLAVLIFLSIGLSLLALFSYKKRMRQIRLSVFNIILLFGLEGLIYFFTKYTLSDMEGFSSVFLWPIVVPFISIILIYLAIKAIQKDQAIIKAYDRIR
jgi:heme A synthase